MSRFDLSKGQRFSFAKDQGLNNLTVTLGWGEGADLDASTFLVGEDGVIEDDANFVYYNSAKRSEDFDRAKFGNKNAWRAQTRPMSADGSVMGSIDDLGDGGDGEGDSSEEMTVDLSKVSPKIVENVFCVTIYEEATTFGHVNAPYISIINDEDGSELCRYDLKENFKAETAVVAGRLLCDEEGEWSFEAVGNGYTGGMQSLIDIYAYA